MNSASPDRAVSPVVAVILMVAITVILSAVIGTFALNLGQKTTQGSHQSVGVTTTQQNGEVTATIVTGTADEVKLLVNGTEVANASNASAGTTLSASVSPGADIVIVTVTGGERSVVSTMEYSADTSGPQYESSLIAYWKFDDGPDGPAVDSVGTHDANLSGASYSSDAIHGTSLAFANGDYAEAPNDDEFATQNITILAYVNTTATGERVVFSKFSANSPFNGSWFGQGGASGGLRACLGDNGQICNEVGDFPNTGSWTFVAFTYHYPTGNWSFYKGTTLVKSVTNKTTIKNPNRTARIGEGHWGRSGNYWSGQIDTVRVYNRALNYSEVMEARKEMKNGE